MAEKNMKKALKITVGLFFVFTIISASAFFMMKRSTTEKNNSSTDSAESSSEIIVENEEDKFSNAAEKLKFFKLNKFSDVKKYANESEIYIMNSDAEGIYGIGELYVENIPIYMNYMLNDEDEINKFSGIFSVELKENDINDVIYFANKMILLLFDLPEFEHNVFSKDGFLLNIYDEETTNELLNGNATYFVSIYDEYDTYWKITATVSKEKVFKFSFMRNYYLGDFVDNYPTIDLRGRDKNENLSENSMADNSDLISGSETVSDEETISGSEAVSDEEAILN